MCMKNVNATILICSDIERINEKTNSLIGIYDSVVPVKEDNLYYLDNFNILLNGCIIFDEKFKDEPDCLQLGKEYEFMIWLTHVESGLGISLYQFSLELEKHELKTWCKDFYEFKRFLKFSKLEIPKGLGNYAIKVFIREKNKEDSPWNSQVIHSLIIGESR